jgi:two-component system, OmpR family, response regulator QseB
LTVLVISNRPELAETLGTHLSASGYEVQIRSAQFAGAYDAFRAIVLVCLAREMHCSLLWGLRHGGMNEPIVAIRFEGAIDSAIALLDAGADAVLDSDSAPALILAQIRASIKRRDFDREEELRIGPLRLLPWEHEVYVGEAVILLTETEFAILHLLMRRRGGVVSKSVLAQLPGMNDELSTGAIEVHIHNLRKKLGPDLIRTVRSVGYSIQLER